MIDLEKLLILKAVTLFKQMPDDLLLQLVMSVVKEERIQPGQPILEEGVKNTNIYIIVSGRVKIHNKEQFISELSEREIFGELSALSFDFPVSCVSAITECLVLKINSISLYEIMNYDIGLAKGIIFALCQRTKSISSQLQQLLTEKNSKGL
ncbi:MAG: cyclic nucleotide-binding domain-containing protein [Tatlockia sp.]|nr:cyclic nucleotide-binding domain-containing protein [Tatlockia sp.]